MSNDDKVTRSDEEWRAQLSEEEFQVTRCSATERAFTGLWATSVQHQIDHLDGKLFVDYISPLKRQRIRKKLEKEQRRRA